MLARFSLAVLLTTGGPSCHDVGENGLPTRDAAGFDVDNTVDARSVAPDATNGDASGIRDQCNPVTQMNCPSTQSKCVVEGGGGTECAPLNQDDRPVGSPCQGRDCLPGLACALPTETSTRAACVQVCDLTTGTGCEPLGPDDECLNRLNGTNWGACATLEPACEPLTQAPCTPSQACQPLLRRTGVREFRCRTAGTGQENDACDTATKVVCARNLVCIATPLGNAFCRRICDPARGNADCTGTRQCIRRVSEPPFMYCAP